jgi:uncharacterized protein YndB with AHSA1/START domain
MGDIDFLLERTIKAPPGDVFTRLSDIEGYDAWMPRKGSIRRRSQQTSAGAPALGTTYTDQTAFGPTPGEIVQFRPPDTLGYHWWNKSRSGKLQTEGWPGYTLEAAPNGTTLLRHRATMRTYGLYRLATPMLRVIARRERTATVDALQASFDSSA